MEDLTKIIYGGLKDILKHILVTHTKSTDSTYNNMISTTIMSAFATKFFEFSEISKLFSVKTFNTICYIAFGWSIFSSYFKSFFEGREIYGQILVGILIIVTSIYYFVNKKNNTDIFKKTEIVQRNIPDGSLSFDDTIHILKTYDDLSFADYNYSVLSDNDMYKFDYYLRNENCLAKSNFDFTKMEWIPNGSSGQQIYSWVAEKYPQFKTKIPFFYYKGDLICMLYRSESSIYLYYKNQNIITVFADILNKYEDKISRTSKCQQIMYYDKRPSKKIYPDRTFDRFVSKYKKNIIRMINQFMSVNNSGVPTLGGFGTFNLGFILHGKPGTGKTSLIKAICNYTQRSALIVDMTKIKSKSDFESIFKNCGSCIFVFEEFDQVKDVIQDRSKKSGESLCKKSEWIAERKRLVNIKLTNKDCNKEEVDGQLKIIDTRLLELDQLLDLETMLMILDGVDEYRDRMIIATTNHIDLIDPALLREGRFDMKIELNEFDSNEIRDMLVCMFKDTACDEDMKMIIEANYKNRVHTPVQIINICQMNDNIRTIVDLLKDSD